MRQFPFVIADVFSSRPLEGNQIAVFTDSRGLADVEMQALARETRLSETTFVMPRDPAVEHDQGVQVRIFTVAEELPFAGHPTLGTAAVLCKARGVNQITLDLRAGKIPVRLAADTEGLFGEMTQLDPQFGMVHDRDAVARAIEIPPDDIDTFAPIQTVSVGLPFAIVPLRSLDAIRRLCVDVVAATEYLESTDARFFYFVTRETIYADFDLHARMFFYAGEDPATGSAAGPAGAWMVKHDIVAADTRIAVEQGLEMCRPSRLFVKAFRTGDRVHDLRVGGHTVEVARGEFSLP